MEQRYYGALTNLTLVKYRITCRAQEKILLPPYKGAVLHGGFGFALKDISSFYHKKFCNVDSGPNPIVLLPPLDCETRYLPEQTFSFEITLVGSATEYFPICRDAIEYLGGTLGFGNNRGKFEIIQIDSAVPPSFDGTTEQYPVINGEQIACSRKNTASTQLQLHFITPLRLKADDHVLLKPASFAIFFARIIGRLNSLATFHGNGAIINAEQKQDLLYLAEQIEIAEDKTYRQGFDRFSTRQKQWMKFDGLLGKIVYQGNMLPFLPYFAIAEWVHVGGKTSFGLGKFVMEKC